MSASLCIGDTCPHEYWRQYAPLQRARAQALGTMTFRTWTEARNLEYEVSPVVGTDLPTVSRCADDAGAGAGETQSSNTTARVPRSRARLRIRKVQSRYTRSTNSCRATKNDSILGSTSTYSSLLRQMLQGASHATVVPARLPF